MHADAARHRHRRRPATVNATATATIAITTVTLLTPPPPLLPPPYCHRHRRGVPCPSLPTDRRSDECEKSFGSCLKKHCKAKYPGNEECISTANTFVMGVTAFGCNGYQESQVIGCECVAPAKAEEHTEKVVTNFFAKYNKVRPAPGAPAPTRPRAPAPLAPSPGTSRARFPHSLAPQQTKTPEEVSAALAQYKGKVGTMLNRLYRKYPEAIEIISRDGQAQKRRGEEL